MNLELKVLFSVVHRLVIVAQLVLCWRYRAGRDYLTLVSIIKME